MTTASPDELSAIARRWLADNRVAGTPAAALVLATLKRYYADGPVLDTLARINAARLPAVKS